MTAMAMSQHRLRWRRCQVLYGVLDMNGDAEAAFSERLKTAREKRELSQGQLAERAGLPASSISHFESGARKPSFDNLKRLATTLQVSTDFLLGRVNEMDSVGAAEVIHRHLANLSSTDVQLASDFLEMLSKRRPGS